MKRKFKSDRPLFLFQHVTRNTYFLWPYGINVNFSMQTCIWRKNEFLCWSRIVFFRFNCHLLLTFAKFGGKCEYSTSGAKLFWGVYNEYTGTWNVLSLMHKLKFLVTSFRNYYWFQYILYISFRFRWFILVMSWRDINSFKKTYTSLHIPFECIYYVRWFTHYV